jgi:hypothetical protein
MAIDTVKVTVNGTTVTATSNGNGTYTATLAAPNRTSYNVNSGHYYPITVVATNKAGTATTVNDQTPTLGTSLRLRVLEKNAPTITISSPTSSQYFGTATPQIKFNLTDEANGSGIAISTLKITVDSKVYTNTTSGVTASAITNGYSVTCVPTALTDGSHTVKVEVQDNDGNAATSSTITFITDTIAPTLNVTNPTANGTFVSSAALTVTGTTSDSTSGVPTVKVSLNGTDQGSITVSNGSFSKAVTLVNGSNTIVVTATDKAGRVTTITRTVTLDSSSPVIASVVIDPNPVNVGANYVVTISVTG